MRRRQFSVLFAALVALAAGAAAAAGPLASVPLSRTNLPWWRNRLTEKAAELRHGPVDLVWYGDSITQDFEKDGPEPWRNFVPVWQHFYAGRHAVNLGFNGDTTSNLIWRIENGEAEGIHPRAAIILIGANNFGRLRWPASETAPAIEKIVAELRDRLPGTKLLLIGVLPCVRGPWVDANTAALNRMLAARYRDRQEATFIDVGSLFLTDGKVDPGKFVDPHLHPPAPPLHPDPPTMGAIAAAIEPTLSAMLGDRPRPPM